MKDTLIQVDYRFEDVAGVRSGLSDVSYLADDGIAGIVYLADRLAKPVLIEGPAGTGKTFSLAHLVLRLLTEKEYLVCSLHHSLSDSDQFLIWEAMASRLSSIELMEVLLVELLL